MANEIFDNIWKIIEENKFRPINEISNDLICNICKKLMIKACNVPCGCRYCSDCIVNYLEGKDKFCPGKNKFCQLKMINYDKDVVIDYPISIRISEIVVKCSNKSCEFTDELSLIENHMRICNKMPKCCPYFQIGCKNDQIMNDEMKDHLYREICCHTKLLLDFINNLRNEMESMKKEIIELKSENKHLKQEVQILSNKSEKNEVKNKEFEDKIMNNLSKIEESMKKEITELKSENKHLKQEVHILSNKSENNEVKNQEFEEKIMNNLSEIEELNDEMVFLKNQNRELANKLENIEKSRINEMIETMQIKLDQQTREVGEVKTKCQQTEQKEIEMKRIIDENKVKCQNTENKQIEMKRIIDENKVKCQNTENTLIEMKRIIDENKVKCQNTENKQIEMKRIIDENKVKCQNTENKQIEMKRIIDENKVKCQNTENKQNEMKRIIDENNVKCQNTENTLIKTIQMVEEMNGKYQQINNKEIKMERLVDELINKNSDLIMKSNNYDEKIKEVQKKITEIENLNKIFGKFEWKIENFFQESRMKSINSEPFYSHQNGYKMCLSAWFDDSLYLQVGFHMMKGEFDNNLLWPCKQFVTIDIIIEIGGNLLKQETIKYDDCQDFSGWNKPTEEINCGFCFYEFLKPTAYMNSHPLVIKCKLNT